MMEIAGFLVTFFYLLGLTFILLYSLTQLSLVMSYLRSERNFRKPHNGLKRPRKLEQFPTVTIQLPIFNELYVVERLIDEVAKIDYPLDKLDIQVLDDSTDETIELSRAKVEEYKAKGYNIELIQRPDRIGYKAGALRYGLGLSTAEFVVIFDADFIPEANFLYKTLPYFAEEEKLGLVQTKWEHLNKEYSLLTRIQAFALDAHFVVEQNGRNAMGAFMNFNGTAGVWRRSCIDDAGGWSDDTLTEDLDLSFRAQLKGWHFLYLDHIGSPAELPAVMSAVKSQQYRWSKGPAEVSMKMLLTFLKSDFPFAIKWHGLFHMLNSTIHISVIVTAVLSVPMIFMRMAYPNHWLHWIAVVFLLAFLALAIVYMVTQMHEAKSIKKGFKNFIIWFPSFLSMAMGLSLHNSIAAINGLLGKKSPFVRTPKMSLVEKEGKWKNKKYVDRKIDFITIGEGLLAVYFLIAIFAGLYLGEYGLLPFHLMMFAGFFMIVYFSVKHNLPAAE